MLNLTGDSEHRVREWIARRLSRVEERFYRFRLSKETSVDEMEFSCQFPRVSTGDVDSELWFRLARPHARCQWLLQQLMLRSLLRRSRLLRQRLCGGG